MKRSIFTLLFILFVGFGMSNPVTTTSALGDGVDGFDAKVAVVFSTGGLGDQSFNDAANRGLLASRIAFNLSISTAEPADITEINDALDAFGKGVFDLIIGVGFTATDGINASSSNYPSNNFVLIDSVITADNVHNVVFAEHQGSFLAGALAALTTATDHIAFLGGLDIPLINKFLSGYEQGARYVNPSITISSTYSPNPDNPWGDLAGGKTVAESFIDQGADIIYAAAGGTGIGVMQAAKEAQDGGDMVYAIGVDSNQDHLEPGVVLTSMIKKVETAVETQIKATVDGTWVSGLTALDLAAGGVGITDMEFTQDEANVVCGSATRLEYVNSIGDLIISGDITVDDEIQAAADYNTVAHGCEASTVTGAGGGVTVTVTDDGGVPVNVVPVIFSLIAAVVIVRKRK